MGTEKRARQKAGHQARIAAAQAAQRKAQRRQRITQAVIAVGLLVALLAVVFFINRKDESSTATTGTSTTVSTAPTSTQSTLPGQTTTTAPGTPTPSITAPPPGQTISGDTPCPPADGSAQRTTTFAKAPPMCIDVNKSYTALMSTTKGDITIKLDPKKAPLAVNNFVVLSQYHYYDGTVFHRVIPDFVVQGGDATGAPPGTGGPGYAFADELPASPSEYKVGSFAMANSGPNTNGSQFFIVLSEGKLSPANYSLFGEVTSGMDVVKVIESGGSASGTPTDPAAIKTVTITES